MLWGSKVFRALALELGFDGSKCSSLVAIRRSFRGLQWGATMRAIAFMYYRLLHNYGLESRVYGLSFIVQAHFRVLGGVVV